MSNFWKSLLLLLLCTFLMTSCASAKVTATVNPHLVQPNPKTPLPTDTPIETETPFPDSIENQDVTATSTPFLEKTKRIVQGKATEDGSITREESSMTTIILTIGSSSFSAKLYENDTTKALLANFPLSVNMSELNGQEKYYHLPINLPSPSTVRPETIRAGEIMLWSSNSLVLFYRTFSNTYGGYIRLGYVEDVTGLADALGSGSVQVTFTVSK